MILRGSVVATISASAVKRKVFAPEIVEKTVLIPAMTGIRVPGIYAASQPIMFASTSQL